MDVLLLNQCFHPDLMATGQYLSQLAVGLVERGHGVTVVTSDRGYDDPSIRFPRRETWQGVRIIRIPSFSFGKETKLRRALNFGSFLTICAWRLLFLRRFDVVVALTSPPLISLLGALFVRLKGGRFCFWVMDLNPDEAIAAGWLKEDSFTASLLQRLLKYSLRHASEIIVLDRFMKQRILAKGIDQRHVTIIPPWSQEDSVRFDDEGRQAFRARHGLSEKFVVMYSGNHSPCHPLDTLLEAARRLDDRFVFCFVGGGSEQAKVKGFGERHGLNNVKCLPYQPLNEISGSLSAADLHVVVMGDNFAGIVHPCKIYNVMTIGVPVLYIGPAASHVADLAAQSNSDQFYLTRHGEEDVIVDSILQAASRKMTRSREALRQESAGFAKQLLLPQMIRLIESIANCQSPIVDWSVVSGPTSEIKGDPVQSKIKG